MHGPIVLLLLVNICSTFMGEWQYIFNKNQSLFIVVHFFFCSTLSEFANFLLCERILINVTTCQNETSN
jgi:hypothetical protein